VIVVAEPFDGIGRVGVPDPTEADEVPLAVVLLVIREEVVVPLAIG